MNLPEEIQTKIGTTFTDRKGVIWLCTNDDPNNQQWERIGQQTSIDGEKDE